MFLSSRYESTSSEDSSSESSEEESDSSEYHEAKDKLPDTAAQPNQPTGVPDSPQAPATDLTPLQTASQPPASQPATELSTHLLAVTNTRLQHKPTQSPAMDTVVEQYTSPQPAFDSTLTFQSSVSDCAPQESINQLPDSTVPQESTSETSSTEPAPERDSLQSPPTCSTPQQNTTQSETTEVTQQQEAHTTNLAPQHGANQSTASKQSSQQCTIQASASKPSPDSSPSNSVSANQDSRLE